MKAKSNDLFHVSPDELKAIDDALAAVERGEIASDEEVEAVFTKYRRPLSSPGSSR
jgi:predicted transcriptional regulator